MNLKNSTLQPKWLIFFDWTSLKRKINKQLCNPRCTWESVDEQKHKVLDVLVESSWEGICSQREVSQVTVANMRINPEKKRWEEDLENEGRGPVWCSQGGTGPNRMNDRMWIFSHLMNQVIHWSKCASAQFSCPCFWGSQTSVWAFLHLHWYPEKHHLKEGKRMPWVKSMSNMLSRQQLY